MAAAAKLSHCEQQMLWQMVVVVVVAAVVVKTSRFQTESDCAFAAV